MGMPRPIHVLVQIALAGNLSPTRTTGEPQTHGKHLLAAVSLIMTKTQARCKNLHLVRLRLNIGSTSRMANSSTTPPVSVLTSPTNFLKTRAISTQLKSFYSVPFPYGLLNIVAFLFNKRYHRVHLYGVFSATSNAACDGLCQEQQ